MNPLGSIVLSTRRLGVLSHTTSLPENRTSYLNVNKTHTTTTHIFIVQSVVNEVEYLNLPCCLKHSTDKQRCLIQLQGHFERTNPLGSSKSHLEVMGHLEPANIYLTFSDQSFSLFSTMFMLFIIYLASSFALICISVPQFFHLVFLCFELKNVFLIVSGTKEKDLMGSLGDLARWLGRSRSLGREPTIMP